MFYLISFALHVQAEATFYAEASYAAAFVIFGATITYLSSSSSLDMRI